MVSINLGISQNILHITNCTDMSLAESLSMFTPFHFSDSWLNLLNDFYFYSVWLENENQRWVDPFNFCSGTTVGLPLRDTKKPSNL